MNFNRRQTLGMIGAGSLVAAAPARLAFAQGGGNTDNRLVVVFLRGAMDGLAAVPALGDPNFETAREGIALAPVGQENGALPLDGFFGLHHWLPEFHAAWGRKEMAVVHAVASSYRERSHFDAQNLIENGSTEPYGLASGWLNRAIVDLPIAGDKGVAITPSVPVIMQGPTRVSSWSPSSLPPPSDDLVARAGFLYRDNEQLHEYFESAKAANTGMGNGSDASGFAALMAGAARFLREPEGPRIAFTESGGWDTHAGQSAFNGPLWQAMTALNEGLATFRAEIGDEVWSKTAIVFVTEFGRTVAMNGSNGTDHGTAGAAFVLGGAVDGGKMHADWPGLRSADLYEGRDLRPTLDMRAIFKGVLRDHLGIPTSHIESQVFTDSSSVRPLEGLIRS